MKYWSVLVIGGPKHGEFIAVPEGSSSIERAELADDPFFLLHEAEEGSSPEVTAAVETVTMPIQRRLFEDEAGCFHYQLVVDWYGYC